MAGEKSPRKREKMVRKRGGGTGQGQGGKRQATTPVGGTYKDARRNIQGDEDFDEEDLVIHNKRKSPVKSRKEPTMDEMIFEENVIDQLNKASSNRGSVTGTYCKKKHGSVIDKLNEQAS